MMYHVFLICATIGGTILVLRLVLSLLGFAGDGFDGLDADAPPHDLHVGEGQAHDGHLGRIFTFQAITSFLAFFGIGGLSGLEYGLHPAATVALATAVGLAAVALLGYAVGLLRRLNADGTVRIERAVGLTGVVYLRVPAHDDGEGKITLPIQGRTIEVKARTPGPELRTGEPAFVSRVIDEETVEVVAPQAAMLKPAPLAE